MAPLFEAIAQWWWIKHGDRIWRKLAADSGDSC